MKIWQLDPANLTPYYNLTLCEALADQGIDVRFVSSLYLHDEDLKYPDNIRLDLHYFKLISHPSMSRLRKLRQILRGVSYPYGHWQTLQNARTQPVDIVHLQWSRIPFIDRWLFDQLHKLSIPIVQTVHDSHPLFLQNRLGEGLIDVYEVADALVVHTADTRIRLLDEFPSINEDKIQIIPLIGAPDHYLPASATQADARKKLNIDLNVHLFLLFGTVKHYKGLDILAEACELVNDNFELWVVGKPESQADYDLVDALSKRNNVTVRSGFIPSSDVWLYHLAADVLIYPYRRIFQSAALVSGLNYSRPVIISDIAGLKESFDGNGWVVPPENPEALAQAMTEAIHSTQLETMGQASHRILQEKYSPDVIAQQHLAVYDSLL